MFTKMVGWPTERAIFRIKVTGEVVERRRGAHDDAAIVDLVDDRPDPVADRDRLPSQTWTAHDVEEGEKRNRVFVMVATSR